MANGRKLFTVTTRPTVKSYIGEVWRFRAFALQLPVEEVRVQHLHTVLGHVWHLLNPLILTGIYLLVFGIILNIGRGVDNFVAFLIVGVIYFHFTQRCAIQGGKSVVGNLGLIQSLSFPRILLPTAAVGAQTLAMVPAVSVMLGVVLATGEPVRVQWAVVPILVLAAAAMNAGIALIAARLTHRFRDMENILPFAFRLLFYGSGVLYPVEVFVGESPLRLLFDLNPVYGYVTMARSLVLGTEVSTVVIVAACVWTLALLVGGVLFFVRGEGKYGA